MTAAVPHPPQAVIFDIGNVLIEWQPERFYDARIGTAARRALFAAVDLHEANERVDRGADFRETIYTLAEAEPAYRDLVRMWHDNWLEMARPEIPHSVALLRALRARAVAVFALSNFGRETFEIARGHYPFLDEFDRRYISGQMGVTKPDSAIYARVEEDCGLAPGDLLFVDDRSDNIAAAAARGWRTHRFDGPTGWARRLVAEGLLTPQEAGLV